MIPGFAGKLLITYLPEAEGAVAQHLVEVKVDGAMPQPVAQEALIVDTLPADMSEVPVRQNPRRSPLPAPPPAPVSGSP
ncbi:MAG: hypothetical protein ACK47O_09750, partial [Betaproteobacteria bacterium]